MQWVDASHWTADFQLARVFWEAWREGSWESVHVVCLGDPSFPFDVPILEVGQELRRYHPHVYGTPDRPLSRSTVYEMVQSHGDAWARGLLIAVAAGVSYEGDTRIGVLTGQEVAVGVQPPDWDRQPPQLAVPLLPQPFSSPEGATVSGSEDDPAEGADWVVFPDVIVLPVVARWEGDVPRLLHRSRLKKVRDVTIDAMLRFYLKIGHDHTLYQQQRRNRT